MNTPDSTPSRGRPEESARPVLLLDAMMPRAVANGLPPAAGVVMAADRPALRTGSDVLLFAAGADMLILDRSPARLAAIGLDPAVLTRAHERLVVVSVTPSGLRGPRRDWADSAHGVSHAQIAASLSRLPPVAGRASRSNPVPTRAQGYHRAPGHKFCARTRVGRSLH